VIKSAGHLIGPFEVESVLAEHPAVAEAGVIGIPDAVAGQLVKAGLLSDADLEQLEDAVAREIEEAIAFAGAGTLEPVEELERLLYFEGAAP